MNEKNLRFSSLEEVKNYFAKKDVSKMDVQEAVETKYAVKTILTVLQQNEAPAIVTNFWYLLLRLIEERLKMLGYKVIDMNIDDFINIVHVVPEDLLRSHPHDIAQQMFEDVDNEMLGELLCQLIAEKPQNDDLLNMMRLEYARRNKLN
ncbi:MAG: hypothetical protein IJW72_06660 [Alphaproteobacteria bacterium]|nr:hypothetical protein [Alphaproteobacteria bacterium]